MASKFKLSFASTIYRVILLSLLIVKASLQDALINPEMRGTLFAEILIYLWLLPFVVVKITRILLAGRTQPFFVLHHDRIVNSIFKISVTLFFIVAVTSS